MQKVQTRYETYSPSNYGKKEEEFMAKFNLQFQDAKTYFKTIIKPRLDRSYKLYIAYNGDRQFQIKNWQSNIFVPYVQSVVETLMPRVLDARPDFSVQGRTEDDQAKAEKQQQLMDYLWEISGMDKIAEDIVRASLIYGIGYMQAFWKKDVRLQKFLKSADIAAKKYKWEEEERTFYDNPCAEWVDNYSLFYDWHNTARENKQYWFKRLILTAPEIRRKYPNAHKDRLNTALKNPGGDLEDYASIRARVKQNHESVIKSSGRATDSERDYVNFGSGYGDKYQTYGSEDLQMYEVVEWTQPFEDSYSVHVGASNMPIFDKGFMPIPYDFKEAAFIDIPYLKVPGEFEGYGLPMILENPQIMMNMIKNQRLDSATLAIHKMWIVNPLANVNKDELVTRPFGIIYSVDPNGVKEVQFSDIKTSAYKEEDLLKADMRYASGVDDFSMGVGGGAGSATEVRHLRESTLERVRLYINHMGEGFSLLMRYWMDMERQFSTKDQTIRIIGDDGKELFPLIQKNDLEGNFDYKAAVMPSIAGQQDINKKQGMDLFQLLINLPFVDPQKLTQKVLADWNWSLDSIAKAEEAEEPMVDENGMPIEQGPIEEEIQGAPTLEPPMAGTKNIPQGVAQNALELLRGGKNAPPFREARAPINLLNRGAPPTAEGVKLPTSNPRGMNMGGKVNTASTGIGRNNSTPESALARRSSSIQ